ncbi:hypothetical protein ACIRCZ_03160 [Leifsonia sp. NPDC102414]|uniref:hypothetical protein n=1 Tax=Leifsonia sp. NPDC102414 TaxID=3364124 RepID=UPI0037FB4820
MATESLVERLLGMAASGDVPAAVQLAAIRDALDRANVVGTQQLQVEVGVSQWDQMKAKFVRTVHIGELEAKALETVVDAELIEEDPEHEARLDEQMRENEQRRQRRKRNGHPASLPSEDPATAPAKHGQTSEAERADFAVEPPTRKTDADWRAEGFARARRGDGDGLRPLGRVKRR